MCNCVKHAQWKGERTVASDVCSSCLKGQLEIVYSKLRDAFEREDALEVRVKELEAQVKP
jgi:hypothetical protein